MTTIKRFEIKKLHGYKNVDLRLDDNTVILVGENGAGKTTILHLFYYLLSGQWSSPPARISPQGASQRSCGKYART